MKTAIIALCSLVAISAATVSAQENGQYNQGRTDQNNQAGQQTTEAAKPEDRSKVQHVGEQKTESQDGRQPGSNSNNTTEQK